MQHSTDASKTFKTGRVISKKTNDLIN